MEVAAWQVPDCVSAMSDLFQPVETVTYSCPWCHWSSANKESVKLHMNGCQRDVTYQMRDVERGRAWRPAESNDG